MFDFIEQHCISGFGNMVTSEHGIVFLVIEGCATGDMRNHMPTVFMVSCGSTFQWLGPISQQWYVLIVCYVTDGVLAWVADWPVQRSAWKSR